MLRLRRCRTMAIAMAPPIATTMSTALATAMPTILPAMLEPIARELSPDVAGASVASIRNVPGLATCRVKTARPSREPKL
jgi:hypothetical protein